MSNQTIIIATDMTDNHCDVYSVHNDIDSAEEEARSLRPGIVGLGVWTGDEAPVEGERVSTSNVRWL